MKSRFVMVIVFALVLAGCAGQSTATADPALAEFVVGAWLYDGGPEASMQYTFERGTTAWLSTGEVGSQCTYAFAGADILRLTCDPDQFAVRAVRVKQEGASLVIQELDEKLKPLGAPRTFVRVGG
jgi:hypothetical protein